jgi:hypothetical protein
MPTSKPRIAITLEPEQYDVLKRLAAAQGGSMAGIVSDLLDEMLPVLGRVVDTLELARKAQGEVKESVRAAVDQAEGTILPHAQLILEQYVAFGDQLKALGEQIGEATTRDGMADAAADGRPASAEKAPDPVTRGLREANEGQKRAPGKETGGLPLPVKPDRTEAA